LIITIHNFTARVMDHLPCNVPYAREAFLNIQSRLMLVNVGLCSADINSFNNFLCIYTSLFYMILMFIFLICWCNYIFSNDQL